MSQIRHRCLGAVALIALSASLLLYAHEGHGGKEVGAYDLDAPRIVSPETAAHIGLKTAEVDFGAVEDVLAVTGMVRAAPDRHWSISTRTAGKVLSVQVQVGDPVRAGQPLVEIDSPELAKNIYEVRKLETDYQRLLLDIVRSEGRVEQLTVEAANSEATAALAKSELERLESAGANVVPLNVMSERRAVSLRASGEAKLKAVDLTVATKETTALKEQAQALRLSRDALLAMANVEPAQQSAITQPAADSPINIVRLLAPADGVVVERMARPGHWAAAGETLLSVADYSIVQIEGELPESLIPRVALRSSDVVRVRIPAQPTFVAPGRIKFISPVLDPIKRTAHVLIQCDNSDGMLRDGMFVDLAIVLREEKTAVVVPASAVVQSGPIHFVFLKSGEAYKKQDITPGLSNDQIIEVLGGLAPGDVVVTQGAYSLTQLRPSANVSIAAAPPATETHKH